MYSWIKRLLCRPWDKFGNVSYTLEENSAGQFFILFSTKKEIDFFHCTMWNEKVWKSQAERAPSLVLFADMYVYMYVYMYAAIRGIAYIIKKDSAQGGQRMCSKTDGPRDYHSKWKKSGRESQIPYNVTYMWNLKKWYK